MIKNVALLSISYLFVACIVLISLLGKQTTLEIIGDVMNLIVK